MTASNPPNRTLDRLIQIITAAWPVERWSNLTVLVAVSGGGDSISLLHLLHRIRPKSTSLAVAHFNHRLRGEESEADLAFVQQLATELSLPFFPGSPSQPSEDSADELQPSPTDHSEESLRTERYRFLERTANQIGARYIAIGHTADDRVETVLHQLFRGTGIRGLASPQMFQPLNNDLVIARPLLGVPRQSLRELLAEERLSYREDRSNASDRYARNRIRNTLLPQIRENGYPNVDDSILRLAENAAELREWLEFEAQRVAGQVIASQDRDRILLRLPECRHVGWPVLHELLQQHWIRAHWPLQAMTRKHWLQIKQCISGIPTSHLPAHLPGKILLLLSPSQETLELSRMS